MAEQLPEEVAAVYFGAPVVFRVGEEDVEFPRLTTKHYAQLEQAVRAANKAVAVDVSGTLGLDGTARFEPVFFAARQPVSLGDIYLHLGTVDGAKRAISMSLDEAKVLPDRKQQLIDRMPPAALFYVARDIMGMVDHRGDPAPLSGSGEST